MIHTILFFFPLFLYFIPIESVEITKATSIPLLHPLKKGTNYFDVLPTPLIEMIMNQLPIKQQWTNFNAFPEIFPCPSTFIYNYRVEPNRYFSPQTSNSSLEKRSHEIIRGLLCASDVSFKDYEFLVHAILSNAIIKHLEMKNPRERKANQIKSFRIEANVIMFQQLIYLLQIDFSSLEHLSIDLFGSDKKKDNQLQLPNLPDNLNSLKSIHISGIAKSIEISHMIQHLLFHSQSLQKISMDCVFLRSLPDQDIFQHNQDWKKAVTKMISKLSSISMEICSRKFNYDFYKILLKNQSSSLKELKLHSEFNDPAVYENDMNLGLKESLKEFKNLEKMEVDSHDDSKVNEVHMMLLSNNIHLKHLVIYIRLSWYCLKFLSTNEYMDWKEKMRGLKELKSLEIYIHSDGFYYFPNNFLMNIVEGIKNTLTLKKLTLDWIYHKGQNTTALMKEIHEIKSLDFIHLPDALGMNRN